MSEPIENAEPDSLMEKFQEKVHQYQDSSSSSSSDSDNEKEEKKPSHKQSSSAGSPKKTRLFGRVQAVHAVLGGGKSADILLWRNKQMSASILVGVTVIWLLFEWIGYHLLTFICHGLILALGLLFCWSNVSSAINKSPPRFPEVNLPEELFVSVAISIRCEVNRGLAILRQVAAGKDLKKFLVVIAALWFLSVVGSWFNFLTLFYLVTVLVHTLPVLYEKHEEKVDKFAERALVELKKHYAALDNKVLKKLPRGPSFNEKKQH